MRGIHATALFCEDIRREASRRDTLIGVFADNVYLSRFPGALRRLQLYFRIRLDPSLAYNEPVTVDIDIPGSDIEVEDVKVDPVPKEIIEQSIKKARDQQLPFATIIARLSLSEPFPVPSPRTIKAIVRYGDESEVCGVLNIMERSTDGSISSEQPPSQSPSGA